MTSADGAQVLIQAAVGRVIGHHVDLLAPEMKRRGDEIHAADVNRAQQHAALCLLCLAEQLVVVDGDQRVDLLGGQR